MSTSANFGQPDPATYRDDERAYLREIRAEVLPPLEELITEHEQMLREAAAAKRIEKLSFSHTITTWRARQMRRERYGSPIAS